jgi:CNT family concentrative nucleoside transporter
VFVTTPAEHGEEIKMPQQLVSFFGLVTFLFLAWLLSNNRKRMNWRVIFGGLLLQFILGFFILHTPFGEAFFMIARKGITRIIDLSDLGAKFIFGDSFMDHFFAFKVLPTIVFMSSLSYLMVYWGIAQKIISVLGLVMSKTMGISGSESLVSAANIFCGQTEAPLFIKPYIPKMTRSEINTMMTAGMAHVSGGIMAAYVGFGISAGHLIAASIMSAPGAILISKIIYPETESPQFSATKGDFEIEDVNAFQAACSGAIQGLQMALNVAAVLIAYIGLIGLVNVLLGYAGGVVGLEALTLETIFGTLFRPIAFLMGISWEDSFIVGRLLGEKMAVNEFLAYTHLRDNVGLLSPRAFTLTTYALCGFANFSSIAIQIGGVGALAPNRKIDLARCGFKAMLGGFLASLLAASIAGILL